VQWQQPDRPYRVLEGVDGCANSGGPGELVQAVGHGGQGMVSRLLIEVVLWIHKVSGHQV
jgi:hypothetical protein